MSLQQAVDEQLSVLLSAVSAALKTRSSQLVLHAWSKSDYLPLLPFQLHLRWPDRVPDLPLVAKLAFAPFSGSDALAVEALLYRVDDACKVRTSERVRRFNEQRSLPEDMRISDWEQGVAKKKQKFGHMMLPATSFVAVDRITSSGNVARGHRPVLGRHVPRNSLRPNVLVPTLSCDLQQIGKSLSNLDLLVLNVQSLRGRRAIECVRQLLNQRAQQTPTVIVASTPVDLMWLDITIESQDVQLIGSAPVVEMVKIIPVGRDRPSAEREFEFSIEGLGKDWTGTAVLELAKAAWWACRQSVCIDSDIREVVRFVEAADALTERNPSEGAMLTSLRQVILKQQQQNELRRERYLAVIDAVNTATGAAQIVLIVRDEATARQMRTALATLLGVTEDDLATLGVRVKGPRPAWHLGSVGTCIAAGFFGVGTIDALLATRAPKLCLILDPIEARVAWFGVQRQIEWLTMVGRKDAAEPLVTIANELAQYVIGFSDVVNLSLALPASQSGMLAHAPRYMPAANEVAVYFDDGTRLDVGLHSRFEIFGEGGRRLRTVMAAQLQPGDQVVVLEEGSRALFSEKVLAALDHGPLAQQAEKRSTWLTLVQTIIAAQKPKAKELGRRMAEKGQEVDASTIRTWLKAPLEGLPTVPESWEKFLAFAAALGLTLDAQTLREFYSSIERWRIAHRTMGRDLARAIRAAYLGRLGAESAARIERLWGMDARHLVEAARVAMVDEIVLPEESSNAAE